MSGTRFDPTWCRKCHAPVFTIRSKTDPVVVRWLCDSCNRILKTMVVNKESNNER